VFYIPGEWTADRIKKEKRAELDEAKRKQDNWYKYLVGAADSMWARSNGNPLSISDTMRLAAQELNLGTTKEWVKDAERVELVRCKACGSLKNPLYPICPNCKAIDDPERAKILGLTFAQ